MHRYTKSCAQCGNSFTTDRKETRACSKSCAAFMAKPLPWFECSKCMAAIGLGLKSAAKLIGIVSFASIGSAWSVRGIKRTVPAEGSWELYARRRRLVGQAIGMKSREFGELWMSEYSPKFPDWSSIWNKEVARRKMAQRYQNMTDEERRDWNRASTKRRMECPIQAEKQRQKSRIWKKNNPDKNRESNLKSMKARKLRDPGFKIACNLRNRFGEIMEVTRDPSRKWNSALIGCDTHQLAAHLESKFKRGMTWANYGTHWHVDHIMPCAVFDHTKPEQVRQCWHFSNLAPLEAKKNMAKGANIEAPQLSLLLSV